MSFETIEVNKNWSVKVYEKPDKNGILRFLLVQSGKIEETEVDYHIESKFLVYNTDDRDPVKPVRDAIRANLMSRGHGIRKTFYTLSITKEMQALDDILCRVEGLKAHKKFYGDEWSLAQSRYNYVKQFEDLYRYYDRELLTYIHEKYAQVQEFISKK